MNVTSEVNGLTSVQSARAESASGQSVDRDQSSAVGPDRAVSTLILSPEVGQVEQIRDLAKSELSARPDVVAQARADMSAGTLAADPSELAAMIFRDIF